MACAEPVFRTAKNRPEYPSGGFADLDKARAWAKGLVHGYDKEHPTAASAASRRNERSAWGWSRAGNWLVGIGRAVALMFVHESQQRMTLTG